MLFWFRLRWLLDGVAPELTWEVLRESDVFVPVGLTAATVETRIRSTDEISAVREQLETMEEKGPNLQ